MTIFKLYFANNCSLTKFKQLNNIIDIIKIKNQELFNLILINRYLLIIQL
jgi:hypothetical protein